MCKYYFTSSIETITKLEVENKKEQTVKNSIIGLIYKVLQTGSDSVLLNDYGKIHIGLTNNDVKQSDGCFKYRSKSYTL